MSPDDGIDDQSAVADVWAAHVREAVKALSALEPSDFEVLSEVIRAALSFPALPSDRYPMFVRALGYASVGPHGIDVRGLISLLRDGAAVNSEALEGLSEPARDWLLRERAISGWLLREALNAGMRTNDWRLIDVERWVDSDGDQVARVRIHKYDEDRFDLEMLAESYGNLLTILIRDFIDLGPAFLAEVSAQARERLQTPAGALTEWLAESASLEPEVDPESPTDV